MSKIKEGLSAIAREVLEDAEKEAEALVLNVEKEAKETLKETKSEADKIYTTTMSEAAVKIEVESRRIQSLSEVEARNLLLETKEALVDKAFEKAQSQFNSFVKTEAYHGYLLTLIKEAAKNLETKDLVVYVNQVDKTWLAKGHLQKLSEKLLIDLKLGKEVEPILGGCKIQTVDGKKTYDNTLENQLKQLRPVLRGEIAQVLFTEEEKQNAR